MTQAFRPTRTAALERLAAFLPHAGRDYAARRNYDLGPGNHRHVSCLSPYLRVRLLTEEEVLAAVLDRHGARAAEKFVDEVFWRAYWKGWLEQRPAVWEDFLRGLYRARDAVQTQAGLRARWEAACKGETGIDCFDAWARELAGTGYLHNHARMWFASIWIFTLDLPWELGADFFLRHLLDGDPASNTLGWRWVAGIQTPGKTYLARASNIAKYTEERFHPKWQLAGEAPAVPSAPAPAPQTLIEMPAPDHGLRTGLLLHEEDLSPGFALGSWEPAACAMLAPQTTAGPWITAEAVTAFRRAAQDDCLARWQDRTGPVTHVGDAQAILDWAREEGLEQIVTPHAPVGPTAGVLRKVAAGTLPLVRVLRPYDRMTWPHATKGFFAFRKRIPDFISQMRVPAAT